MKATLGVELSAESLKVAVALQKGAQLKLHQCIAFARSTQSFSDEQIGPAVAAELKRAKYKAKSVVVSFPRNLATVRNLHLPTSNAEEIEKMIGFHVIRIVPHKIEDVIYSYCISGTDDKGYRRITLAIAHKDVAKKQLKILDKAGFLVDRITLSSYCVWQRTLRECHNEIKKDQLYIIIDVDVAFTDFIVFDRGNLLFTRSIAVKSSKIRDLGLTKLLGEVKQSLLVFQNEEVSKKPQRIFLSGAIADSHKEQIEEELEMPVTCVPGPVCDIGKKDENVQGNVSFSAVSNVIRVVGDKENLSFVLPEMVIRKSLKEKVRGLVIMASLIIFFLGTVCFLFSGRIYNKRNYLDQLESGYGRIEQDIGNLAEQLEKVKFVKNYLYARQVHLYALYQLQRVMPANMALNKVRVDAQGKTALQGQVFQLSDVFRFVSALEQVDHFKDVKTKYTRQGRWKDRVVTDFEVRFRLDVDPLVDK